jgi:hypothetical protein
MNQTVESREINKQYNNACVPKSQEKRQGEF